jgi:hypothetical protein
MQADRAWQDSPQKPFRTALGHFLGGLRFPCQFFDTIFKTKENESLSLAYFFLLD